MGKGSSPTPPDPYETASAQTTSNIDTAKAQSTLNNVNQITPYGNLTYTQTGEMNGVPQYTATQTLSASQQALKDEQDKDALNLAQVGTSQSEKIGSLLNTPADASGLPSAGDTSSIRSVNLNRIASNPQLQSDIGATSNYRNVEGGPQLQTGIADAGDITTTYGTDFSEDRQRVEDALMERMSQYLDQRRESEMQSLADRGIRIGSDAYSTAIDDLNAGENDAVLAAILNAGTEQSRLAELEANRAAFENSAQSQQYGQNANDAAFANDAAQTMFGNAVTTATLNNDVADREFNQAASRANFANNAAQQMYANDANTASLNNNAGMNEANADLALFDAQNTQRSMSLAEMLQLRNQALNENIGLATGTQIQTPSYVSTPSTGVANTDIAGLISNNYNQQVNAYNQQQANANQMLGGLFGAGANLLMLSDDRAKKDIRRVGSYGRLGLYIFRYIDESEKAPLRFGFMSSEVKKVAPEAVQRGPDGFDRVDYAMAMGAA
jgi:hypothetical protein